MSPAPGDEPVLSGLLSLDPRQVLGRIDLGRPQLERVYAELNTGTDEALAELLSHYRRRFSLPADPPTSGAKDMQLAEQLVRHEFQWGPYKPVAYGALPLNWELQQANNDIIAPLYRFEWMRPLANAYVVTRDSRYARAFVELTTDWIAQHPLQVDDDSAARKWHGYGFAWYPIQVGRRAKNLCYAFPALIHSEAFTPGFLGILLASAYDHAVKAQKPSRELFHNMAIFEARGFADLAATFNEFAEAPHWLDWAIRRTLEKLIGQVSADGVQLEWAGRYHLHVLEDVIAVLGHARRVDHAAGDQLLDLVRQMFEYIFGIATPDLEFPMFGDSARPSFPPDQRCNQTLYEPLLEASALLHDPKYAALAQLDHDQLPGKFNYAYLHAGMYAMRSGWGPDQIYFALHCSPPPMPLSGHDHPDNGTFELYAYGRWLMVDSGYYMYAADPTARAWHRQSRAHQTLTLNNDTTEIDGRPLLWHSTPHGTTACVENPSYPGLVHRRTVWFVDNSFFVLLDEAIGGTAGALDLHFQLAPGKAIVDAERKSVRTAFEDVNILIMPAHAADLTLIDEEGWHSQTYGVRQSRKAFRYRHRSAAPAAFVTMLMLYRGLNSPVCHLELPREHRPGDRRVDLRVAAFGKTWRIGRDLDRRETWHEKQ